MKYDMYKIEDKNETFKVYGDYPYIKRLLKDNPEYKVVEVGKSTLTLLSPCYTFEQKYKTHLAIFVRSNEVVYTTGPGLGLTVTFNLKSKTLFCKYLCMDYHKENENLLNEFLDAINYNGGFTKPPDMYDY